MKNHINKEQGNILVTSLMILVVMNLLGVGLVQGTVRESQTATYKTLDSGVFYIAESCTRDAIDWLEGLTRPPDAAVLPYQINEANLDHLLAGDETQTELNKLAGYSYNCTVTELITKSESAEDEGVGEEVGVVSGYGIVGDMSPKYYYQIASTGLGPQNSVKNIFTIVSVEF